MQRGGLFATLALLASAAPAFADDAAKVSSYEQEAHTLSANVPQPGALAFGTQHTLTDAQVAFSLGDYDTAASTLFALANQPGPDRDTATYYLGETLYQKGDRGAARGYFAQVVAAPGGRYYQPSLVRLVEIAIVQRDMPGAGDALGKLTAAGATPEVAYVRGKLAFAQDQYDDAIGAFASIPKGSSFELQALYYIGAAEVAKKDLAKATDTFTDLISRKPRSGVDRRVVELGQLALGRLYYEREEPSKSIDAYLLIDRHSDLFPDALYEVAWVYVKGKQFDKALRALELLEESNPGSTRTPTTRILEGNLRIRKAQAIRLAQIEGTSLTNDTQDPGVEYDKAVKIFSETHDTYYPSYQALTQVVDGNLDAAAFIEQLAGRQTHTFSAAPPIPDAAAQWLRDEPEVQRIVDVEQDLGEIAYSLRVTEEMIARLEAALSAGDRTSLYPELAARRHRIAAIQSDLAIVRADLADREVKLVGDAQGGGATAARKQLQQQYAALGDPEVAYAQEVQRQRQGFEQVDTEVTEIQSTIGSTQAMAIAMRTYAQTQAALDPGMKGAIAETLDTGAKEAQSIEDELAQIRREAALGRDLAGVGDPTIMQARELRHQLTGAEDAEQRALSAAAGASKDPGESRRLADLANRAAAVAQQLDQTDAQIDQSVAAAVDQVKVELAQQQQSLAQYRQELDDFDKEAHDLGGQVLTQSFKDVKAKLYDVVIRTDVGVVDVSWSRKEDDDDDLKRLNLARGRELKQLHDEFKDVLDETTAPKPAPRKSDLPPPTEEGASPTSPDKATKPGADRVKPSDSPTTSTQPNVKPGGGK